MSCSWSCDLRLMEHLPVESKAPGLYTLLPMGAVSLTSCSLSTFSWCHCTSDISITAFVPQLCLRLILTSPPSNIRFTGLYTQMSIRNG